MPHYKDRTNSVYWFDADDEKQRYAPHLTAISDEEARTLCNRPSSFEDAKAFKRAEIAQEREKKLAGGVTFNGVRYDSDDKAQLRITGAITQMSILSGQGIEMPPQAWVAMDDSVHQLQMADLIALGMAVSAHVTACVLAANAHKTAVDSLDNALAIAAYDIGTGWPQ